MIGGANGSPLARSIRESNHFLEHRSMLQLSHLVSRCALALALSLPGIAPAVSQPAEPKTAASPLVPQLPPASPWGFNLSLYLWAAGATGNFSAGPLSRSVDASFLDINSKSSRFPLGFMGRMEAHYERFGVYLDGNYMDLQLKPRFGPLSSGLDSSLGLLDYGVLYRLFGQTSAEVASMPAGQKQSNKLDVYLGARTLWLDNSVTLLNPISFSKNEHRSGSTFTSPILGGRFSVDFTPEIFMLVDGNVGGFGADRVNFTGGVLGMLGYRLPVALMPVSVELGYKLIRYDVDRKGPTQTNAYLNGPFLGITGHW